MDLAAAKKRLASFAVVMLLEHYAEGLLAFCKRLGWPDATCRQPPNRGGPPWRRLSVGDDRDQGRRRLGQGTSNLAKVIATRNVSLDGFADVVDETQLSQGLYFYAREINRADHMLLGLDPLGTSFLPPGEADIFATRGDA